MILLSKTVEYALRAAVCLASRHAEPMVTHRLAELTRVPPGYLAKVLQRMGRGGLVDAQRGLHGGFSLTRPPNEITILDVLNAVEPMPRIRGCPLGLESHGTNLCPLHRQMDDALATIERTFAGSTLADLLNEPATSPPLCDVSVKVSKPARTRRKAPARASTGK